MSMDNKAFEHSVLKDLAFSMKMVAAGMFAVLVGILFWIAIIWFCSYITRILF